MARYSRSRGFSLIEIIIVLAIGALILGTAFIGVPAAQRNNRDAQRKSAMQNVAIGIKAYQSAHEGCLPTSAVILSGDCIGVSTSIGAAGPLSGAIVTGGYIDADKIGNDPTSHSPYNFSQGVLPGASCSFSGGPSTITYTRTDDKHFSLSVCLETNDVYSQDFGS